jgi:integrase
VARFTDPDEGREIDVAMERLGLTSEAGRVEWAIRKSKQIRQRLAELASGAPKVGSTPVEDAIELWKTANVAGWRPPTVVRYDKALKTFRAWAGTEGLARIEDLGPEQLGRLRDFMVNKRKDQPRAGGARGERIATAEVRAASSMNSDLACLKSMLNQLRKRGHLPRLDRDAVCDLLKGVRVDRERPAYLQPRECQRLLDAAIRHDCEVFTMTRREHAGMLPAGSTRRYLPISPFVATVLLTGCRKSEVTGLRDELDLESLDHSRQRVGRIVLRADRVKNRWAREVGLEVSPGIRRILAALALAAPADATFVFGDEEGLSEYLVESSRKRLVDVYGAPEFTWQMLRATAATFLTNSGIFGAATHYQSARQLGHSVVVAQQHYVGIERGIDPGLRTLDEVLGVGAQLRAILGQVTPAGSEAAI